MLLQGDSLNDAIERELELMLAEGYEVAPIAAKSLHMRLVKRGYIKGGLSTLSTKFRRLIINEYKTKQLSKAGLSEKTRRNILKGKNTEYYKNRYREKCSELDSVKVKFEQNTAFLVDLILELEATCPTSVEKLLTPHLVKAKHKKKQE